MFNIEWVGSPNYRSGRNGKQPIAIVDHITAGLFPGCLTWMQNPKAQASAHYLVTKTGRIFQLVKDEDSAWHAGGVNKPNWSLYDGTNPNTYTIGIEHEGLAGEGLTEEQFNATAWLHAHLIEKWKLPIDDNHIIGHYRIDSVNRPNCPGSKFPWNSLFKVLKGETEKPIIQTGSNFIQLGFVPFYKEELSTGEKKRFIVHKDAYNYVCFWEDGTVTLHSKDKEVKQII